jgi:thiamine biosynthesis lipoprotein
MPRAEWSFPAIGTEWNLDSSRAFDPTLREAVQATVAEFDLAWSRFRDDSFVAELRRTPGRYALPPDGAAMLDFYRRLHALTDGAVTPLIGGSLERLGYDADYSLTPAGGPLAPTDLDVLSVGGDWIDTSAAVLLDVGAAGKGRLIDLISAKLRLAGHDDFVVDGSGDLLIVGATAPLRIALEDPRDSGKAIGVARVSDAALCASAANRRAWGESLHHILDGRTGEPTIDVAATWVVAETAMIADGLATALFFAEPGRLATVFDFEYVRMHTGGQADWSVGFDGEVFR